MFLLTYNKPIIKNHNSWFHNNAPPRAAFTSDHGACVTKNRLRTEESSSDIETKQAHNCYEVNVSSLTIFKMHWKSAVVIDISVYKG